MRQNRKQESMDNDDSNQMGFPRLQYINEPTEFVWANKKLENWGLSNSFHER